MGRPGGRQTGRSGPLGSIVMTVIAVILGVVALGAIAATIVGMRRLHQQRAATAAAQQSVVDAQQQVAVADAARKQADEHAMDARETQQVAEARAAAADDALAEFKATELERLRRAATGLDPELMWALELTRSERTWRHSVSIGPNQSSVLIGSVNVLADVLQVEADAIREEVGTYVEVHADVPADVTAAGCLLALRMAQELLATVVRHVETSILEVHSDGTDIVITLWSTDEHGASIEPGTLAMPTSEGVQPIHGGVRICNVIAARVAAGGVLPDPLHEVGASDTDLHTG